MVFDVHDTVIEDKVWVAFVRRDCQIDLLPFREYCKMDFPAFQLFNKSAKFWDFS